MHLLLPSDVLRRMRRHLLRAGRREIGGMIMGEEVCDQTFQVVDFSVDATSGTNSNFVRDANQHDQALSAFFEKTGKNYARFNYLGEWHSHPSFSVCPSPQDVYAMQDLVAGPDDVDFAVLLITRLRWYCQFDCSAHLFVRDHVPTKVDVVRINQRAFQMGTA
ncbi:MAG: Mov34/MPN/PAD-1 family protein [Wenzhouxiangella sp.]|nr:Mov34/MPN/PAD-1 family protein [Wenzhouxiangella sp.]